jgi:hypothetical protein
VSGVEVELGVTDPVMLRRLQDVLQHRAREDGRGGNCFEAAYVIARCLDLYEPVVAHGLAIGRGPANLGKRFWHGWVEITHPAGRLAVDFSSGRRVAMKRSKYYRVGGIDPEGVYRYGIEEAMVEMLRYEHYGPWVPGWEGMADV